MKIVVDEKKINELLDRGVENIFVKEELKQKLLSGKRLRVYLGIDPTGPTLHMGHAIPLKKLKQFQELGHQAILLMGDFTAMIGDPTDKLATRRELSHKEVLENLKKYKKQAATFLAFSGSNKAEIKFNSKWLAKMNFEDVLKLASRVTVDQMLKRDMFVRRSEEGKPISIHEFMYPLMQGYDSVALDADVEVGGNDQTFNMLVGRDLAKEILHKSKSVIAMKLLEDNTGKKMGKTENNMVAFDDGPEEMFGKVMSWSDSLIKIGFELCTDIAPESLNFADNPRDLKMKLALEIVKVFHGEEKANEARESFIKTFQRGEVPEDVEEVEAREKPIETLVASGAASSTSAARRLFDEGAVTDVTENRKLSLKDNFKPGNVYKIGKHRFIKIK